MPVFKGTIKKKIKDLYFYLFLLYSVQLLIIMLNILSLLAKVGDLEILSIDPSVTISDRCNFHKGSLKYTKLGRHAQPYLWHLNIESLWRFQRLTVGQCWMAMGGTSVTVGIDFYLVGWMPFMAFNLFIFMFLFIKIVVVLSRHSMTAKLIVKIFLRIKFLSFKNVRWWLKW